MPVRFTASELKLNIKFLFGAAFIVSVITFSLQLLLVKIENDSTESYVSLDESERAINQYRDFIWLVHNRETIGEDFIEMRLVEETKLKRALENINIAFLNDYYNWLSFGIEEFGVKEFIATHDHQRCVNIMQDCRNYLESFRIDHHEEINKLQFQVDAINAIILANIGILVLLFVYSTLFAFYGE